MRSRYSLWVAVFLAAIVLFSSDAAFSQGSEQYLYDELGRLVRVIRPDNTMINYTYDAAGNLLSRTTGSSADIGPPTISGITPPSLRAGGTRSITISGTNLLGGSVSTDNSGIVVVGSVAADTQIIATLDVSQTARLGTTIVTVTTPLGVASGAVAIIAPLLSVSPPTLILNQGERGTLTLSLDEPQPIPTVVTLTSLDPTVATVEASVTIPATDTSIQTMVQGISGGSTIIQTAAGFDLPLVVQVLVIASFSGSGVAETRPPVSVLFQGITTGVAEMRPPVSVLFQGVTTGVAETRPPVSVLFQGITTGVAETQNPVSVELVP